MKNEVRLGRLVQCNCSHTCLPNSIHGYQWLLPRTKSKHMLYQQVQQKNRLEQQQQLSTSNTSLDQLQQQLNCFSLLNNTTTTKQKVNKNKNKRPTFKMPILLETELKKKIAAPEKNNFVLKEFFVKTSYN